MKKAFSIIFFILTIFLYPSPLQALESNKIETTDAFNLKAILTQAGVKLSWGKDANYKTEPDDKGQMNDHYFVLHTYDLSNWANSYQYGRQIVSGENIYNAFDPKPLNGNNYYTVCRGPLNLPTTCSKPIEIKRNVQSSAFFNDINSDNSHFSAIEFLARQGVISGNPDGSFDPNKELNRAEMVRFVISNLGIKPDANVYKNCFPDVRDEWFSADICYAREHGMISGYPDGYFRPSAKVNPPEVLKMIMESLFEKDLHNQTKEEIKAVADTLRNVDMDDWYAPYVALAKNKNILYDSYSRFFNVNQKVYRMWVAEYIFRSNLIIANNYKFYHPFYADLYINVATDKQDLFYNSTSCHKFWPLPPPKYYSDYMKSHYGISEDFPNPENALFPENELPFFHSGFICALADGGVLVSNSIFLTKEKGEKHVIRFNEKGEVTKDQMITCENEYNREPVTLKNNLDADSFTILNCYYSKDKNQIYSPAGLSTGIDPEHFEHVGGGYFKDTKGIYYGLLPLDEIDHETFKILAKDYGADNNKVYLTYRSFEDADVQSFEFLGDYYAKDKNTVYYYTTPLKDVGVEDFTVLENGYGRSKGVIYHRGKRLLESADEESFKILDEGYAIDKKNVYYGSEILESANPDTFAVIDHRYSKDMNQVYSGNTILKGLNPKTFRIIKGEDAQGDFIMDEDQIFWNQIELDWADVKTFEFLGFGYVKDKNYAAYHNRTIPNADPTTFEFVEEWLPSAFARDKNSFYCTTSFMGDAKHFDSEEKRFSCLHPIFGPSSSLKSSF